MAKSQKAYDIWQAAAAAAQQQQQQGPQPAARAAK
jgi:hypothetical protein